MPLATSKHFDASQLISQGAVDEGQGKGVWHIQGRMGGWEEGAWTLVMMRVAQNRSQALN